MQPPYFSFCVALFSFSIAWPLPNEILLKIMNYSLVTLGDLIAPKNHQKIIVIEEIISSGKMDNTGAIKSIIYSIHYPNIGIESINY